MLNSADHSPLVGQIPPPAPHPALLYSQQDREPEQREELGPACCLPSARSSEMAREVVAAVGQELGQCPRPKVVQEPGEPTEPPGCTPGGDSSIACLWATPGHSGCTCTPDGTGLRPRALPARPSLEREQSSSLMSLPGTESHSHGPFLASCPNASCRCPDPRDRPLCYQPPARMAEAYQSAWVTRECSAAAARPLCPPGPDRLACTPPPPLAPQVPSCSLAWSLIRGYHLQLPGVLGFCKGAPGTPWRRGLRAPSFLRD